MEHLKPTEKKKLKIKSKVEGKIQDEAFEILQRNGVRTEQLTMGQIEDIILSMLEYEALKKK